MRMDQPSGKCRLFMYEDISPTRHNSTVVMSHQPQPSAPEAQQPLANIIGAPHQHMKFYVFNDRFDRPLPVGEIGEVCIGGPQVGRGSVALVKCGYMK